VPSIWQLAAVIVGAGAELDHCGPFDARFLATRPTIRFNGPFSTSRTSPFHNFNLSPKNQQDCTSHGPQQELPWSCEGLRWLLARRGVTPHHPSHRRLQLSRCSFPRSVYPRRQLARYKTEHQIRETGSSRIYFAYELISTKPSTCSRTPWARSTSLDNIFGVDAVELEVHDHLLCCHIAVHSSQTGTVHRCVRLFLDDAPFAGTQRPSQGLGSRWNSHRKTSPWSVDIA